MEQELNLVRNEVCCAVVTTLAQLATKGQGDSLKVMGFQPEKLKLLSQIELQVLANTLCQRGAIDMSALRSAIELAEIPQDIQYLLRLGASNKFFQEFCGVVDVPPKWRKLVPPDDDFKNRSISDNKVLWALIEELELESLSVLSLEQMTNIALSLPSSLGAIWAEICKK